MLSKQPLHKKMLSITDFFRKCDQIRNFLRIWPHLLKKFVMENIFCLLNVSHQIVFQKTLKLGNITLDI